MQLYSTFFLIFLESSKHQQIFLWIFFFAMFSFSHFKYYFSQFRRIPSSAILLPPRPPQCRVSGASSGNVVKIIIFRRFIERLFFSFFYRNFPVASLETFPLRRDHDKCEPSKPTELFGASLYQRISIVFSPSINMHKS